MTIRQVVLHKLDVFTFGKYKGSTIRYVIEHEPSYILWLNDEGVVTFPQEILDNAEDESFNDSLSQGDRWHGYAEV